MLAARACLICGSAITARSRTGKCLPCSLLGDGKCRTCGCAVGRDNATGYCARCFLTSDERRALRRKPETAKSCGSCGARVGRRNESGLCRRCFTSTPGYRHAAVERAAAWFGRNPGAKASHSSLRRARMRGAQAEDIDHLAVFARDGWRCQICARPTPASRHGTAYGNAPQLDHRVALAAGGTHTYDNVQCACLRCNFAKGARRIVGQLPIWPRPAARTRSVPTPTCERIGAHPKGGGG